MFHRHYFLASAFAVFLLSSPIAHSQSVSPASEIALREQVLEYYAAWNRRDVPAWSDFLSPDVHWVFTDSNSKRSREIVAAYGAHVLNLYAVKHEIARLKMYDNGTRATLVLRGQHLQLPVRDGQYVRVWDRDPLLARWRLEAGSWRLYYMNENPLESAALAKAEGLE